MVEDKEGQERLPVYIDAIFSRLCFPRSIGWLCNGSRMFDCENDLSIEETEFCEKTGASEAWPGGHS